jgi:hypothetical protein
VITVRSEEKGKKVLDSYEGTARDKLSFIVVEDIAREGGFDEVSLF